MWCVVVTFGNVMEVREERQHQQQKTNENKNEFSSFRTGKDGRVGLYRNAAFIF